MSSLMERPKVQPINEDLLKAVSEDACKSPRKRMNHNFHQLEDTVQRFLNGIEPESYIQPHRHINPLKDEVFLVLKGQGAVIVFSDEGATKEIHPLDSIKGFWGVDIPGGVYHTIVSLQPGSVFYEVKKGPYDPDAAKHFASWAPEENSAEADDYLESLKTKIKEYLNRL